MIGRPEPAALLWAMEVRTSSYPLERSRSALAGFRGTSILMKSSQAFHEVSYRVCCLGSNGAYHRNAALQDSRCKGLVSLMLPGYEHTCPTPNRTLYTHVGDMLWRRQASRSGFRV